VRIYPPFIVAVFCGAFVGGVHTLQWDWSFLLVPSGTLNSGPPPRPRCTHAGDAGPDSWDRRLCRHGPPIVVVQPRGWEILVSPLNLNFASGYVLGLAMIAGNAKGVAVVGGTAGLCIVLFTPQISCWPTRPWARPIGTVFRLCGL
jgi:hypothetical protein